MSVQPGGGVCYQIELAWGRLRRWYLKRFRLAYVARMDSLREGDTTGAPHEILDPRDLKYCATDCSAHWRPEHDAFRWRERIPFARWGLAELQIMGWPLLAVTIFLLGQGGWWRIAAAVPAVSLGLIVYFFRDPPRRIPTAPGSIVSPADGTIVEIAQLEHDDFIRGPAVRISMFLSIFNVHINRAPMAARVVELRYKPGEFISATRPECSIRNECMWIGLEESDSPNRRFTVRQISGMLARRIVCNLKPGQAVARGEKFGMIKLGSRTEVVLPAAGVRVDVKLGDKVRAGCQIIAHWTTLP